jgi:ferric-dicitrate binding protein FerR (iron transport regulator)
MAQIGAAAMMKVLCRWSPKSVSHALIAAAAMFIGLGVPTVLFAQSNDCALVADDRNPSEKILRCDDGLTIRAAPNTRYRLNEPEGQQRPTGAQIDSGALMIEFAPSEGRRNFQILTPHAIAAVRGTKWAVEVGAARSSTLVISGTVEVSRRSGKRSVMLQAGEGADVSAGASPIKVKRWAKKRVQALLARFGQ